MRKSFTTYLQIIVLVSMTSIGQGMLGATKADSLLIALNTTQDDSVQFDILSQLFWEYQRSSPDKALEYAERALEVSTSGNYVRGIAGSLYYLGIISKVKGDYHKALNLYEKAKTKYELINYTKGIAACLTDIGDVSIKQSNYPLALASFNKARELLLMTGNKPQLSRIYHKLGGIYNEQGQYERALEYHQKSLEINIELDFALGVSVNYNNIGNVYFDLEQYDKAKENYLKALEIKKGLNDKKGIASTLNNIGLIFLKNHEFNQAIAYHNQALDAFRELNSKSGESLCLTNLANDYLGTGDFGLAIDYAKKSLKLSEEINLLRTQADSHHVLSEAYAGQHRYDKAWKHQKLYKNFHDSTVNIELVRQVAEMESKFEMEKKEKEIALLNADKVKQDLRIQKQKLQGNLMIGMILFVLTSLGFLYWGYRNKQKLNEKLSELNLAKSRFFANISHEFRTPLTLLLGPLDKLLKNPKQKEKELIRIMYRNASRLLFLDNQLLDLAKLESGKLALNIGKSDIIQALRGMAMSFESFAESQQISFRCIIPNVKTDAFFDMGKLEKIVYNLLSNALKFTPENGTVVIEANIISNKKNLPAWLKNKSGKMLFLCVSDTGPGIPKAQQDAVFDRFYQVDSGYKRSFEGTGLGLSLTKELVELHHGEIVLESDAGKGSTFVVYLPIDKKSFPEAEHSDDCIETAYSSLFTGQLFSGKEGETSGLEENDNSGLEEEGLLQLLIVEDNADMRTYIRDCFTGHYHILEAEDGEKGLSIATNKIPDVVITDLMMPGMDGIELCRKLKTDERSSHIPVILLTALSSVDDRIRGLETGADDYIAKPFNRRELLTRVQNLTAQRKLLRERFGREIKIQAKDITVTPADEVFLNKLIALIEQNIANPDLNVDSLLEVIHLSRSQLHRKLTALTGFSATEFIRNIRLKRAAQLLGQHHGSIAETVYAVGFSSLSYFSKCFQKQFGVNPKDFQLK